MAVVALDVGPLDASAVHLEGHALGIDLAGEEAATSSTEARRSVSAGVSSSLPFSMWLFSRVSLMRASRCWEASPILSR